ncbi:MAG: hypothetical protein COC19_06785 [SAR86 cluster bacterium]|uniref:diguanylate cyclase n=1 Tax=SAR86 cluster bacterium TaxID=2030880 RepID=A0A2A4MIY6_9GAMM|nr:MAG: hypothetical protein COC19_06785 [SAR86 cluster bacterium]
MANNPWRDKYLDAIESHELEKKRQLSYAQLLESALSKTSLAADGEDDELDDCMAELRGTLRGDARQKMPKLLQELEQHLLKLDGKRDHRVNAIQVALQSIVDQLLLQPLKGENRRLLKKFAKQLPVRTEKISDYPQLLSELSTLVKVVISKEQLVKAGFWQNLLGSSNSATSNSGADTSTGEGVRGNGEQNKKETDKKSALRNQLKPASISEPQLAPEIELIIRQLSQIEISSRNAQNLTSIHQSLAAGLTWQSLPSVLDNIKIIVLARLKQSESEFEEFLELLNQRLLQAQDSLVDAEAGAKDDAVLQNSMREELKNIQRSVHESQDLDSLKSSVQGHLDELIEALDTARKNKEKEQGLSLVEQLSALTGKVQQMEQQSERAGEKLAQQRRKALLDSLTQLPNRAAYEERLEQEHERWKRYQHPLTMVVADIDFFKKVNDTFGHQGGDKVLRIIAKSLTNNFRKTDMVARFGGEEFVVLMPETTQAQAIETRNKVREEIAKIPFLFDDQSQQITMSFGVVEFSGDDTGESVFARADKCLYKAKENGRNRVESL